MLKSDVCFPIRVVFAQIFLLLSCSSPCSNWVVEDACGRCPGQNLQKITLTPENKFRELQIEIARTHSDERMYLNSLSLRFPHEQSDLRQTTVTVTTADGTRQFIAYRFQGGQRLLLPEDAAALIIDKLLHSEIVALSVGRFHVEIPVQEFTRAYRT